MKVEAENGLELKVRALIDPCSQAPFISTMILQRLKLNRKKVNIPISGTGAER